MQDKDDMLPKNVQQDISELTKPDVTEHESAWATYRKLPKSHKWPYFYHHFFWPIIVAVVVFAAIVAFVVNMVISPKGQGLGVAFVGVEESDRSMDKLEDGFLKYRALDEKKITFENDLYIDSSNKESASMSLDTLETQMSGGTINTIIGDDSALRSQHLLGYLEPRAHVLPDGQAARARRTRDGRRRRRGEGDRSGQVGGMDAHQGAGPACPALVRERAEQGLRKTVRGLPVRHVTDVCVHMFAISAN